MFSDLSAISNQQPGGWQVAAKAVWGAGECLPSFHTIVAKADKLLGRTLDCLKGCHDGCNTVIFLIL